MLTLHFLLPSPERLGEKFDNVGGGGVWGRKCGLEDVDCIPIAL